MTKKIKRVKKNIVALSVAAASAATMIPVVDILDKTNSLSTELQSVEMFADTGNKYYYSESSFNTIANANGPITLKENGKIIQNLDWYGNVNWTIDVSQIKKKDSDKNSSTRVVDWDFMPNHNWLFVITDKSFVLKIDALTGEILARKDFSSDSELKQANKLGTILFNNSLYVWTNKDKQAHVTQLDRNTLNKKTTTQIQPSESGKYLIDILPIYVGYNIAVWADKTNANGTTGGKFNLTLQFVDDDLKKIPTTKNGKNNDTTIELDKVSQEKDLAIYTFNRTVYNANNTLLIIGNKIFNVYLQKSDMSKSKIEELKFKINGNNITSSTSKATATSGEQDLNLNIINSAFMDMNDTVYLKETDGSKIYSLDFNNKMNVFFDLLGDGSTSSIKEIVAPSKTSSNRELFANGSTPAVKNNLQIFGVRTNDPSVTAASNRSTLNLKNSMFLATPDKNYITVIKENKLSNVNFDTLKPKLRLKSSKVQSFKENVPSVIDPTYFEAVDADKLDPGNISFKANDLEGNLSVKATVSKKAWYSNSNNVKTDSILSLEYKNNSSESTKPKKVSDQVLWAPDNVFKSWFGKYTPEQLVESDLEKQPTLIQIKNATNPNYFRNLEKKIAITKREGRIGKITISGVISYTDRHSNYVNFSIPEKEYTIAKTTGRHSFRFTGAKEDSTGIKNGEDFPETIKEEVIDINTVSDSEVRDLQKFVPTLIDPQFFSKFIEKEESYLPSRRVITKEANDDEGTLKLTVMYNGMDPAIPYKFTQTYNGFSTFTSAKINFKGEEEDDPIIRGIFEKTGETQSMKKITTIPEYIRFKDLVSNEINQDELGDVFSTGLTKMGFTPKITIEKPTSLDNEYGSIVVTLDYEPEKDNPTDPTKIKFPYKDKFGLENYKIQQRFTGLLPIGERFGVDLDKKKAKEIIYAYNVNADIPENKLVDALQLKEFDPTVDKQDDNGNSVRDVISIPYAQWNGEKLIFQVIAQSGQYPSVKIHKKLVLDWAPRFKSIRDRNLAIAIVLSILGVIIVTTGVMIYIMRRTKIRRMLK